MRSIICAAAMLAHAGATCAQDAPQSSEISVFVGKLIDIEQLPDPCASDAPAKTDAEQEERLCITMDALWRARYEVVEVLHGAPHEPRLTVDIADHYGFPSFASYRHALLFVAQTSEHPYLLKYQGFEVHQTTAGTWATCGNPYDERAGDAPRNLRPLSFQHDFGSVSELSEAGIERLFPRDRYRIEHGRAYCTTGVPIRDLYEQVRTGVLAQRGIALPPLP